MKTAKYILTSATTIAALLAGPVGIQAQHGHPGGTAAPPPASATAHGGKAHMDMSKMMQSPHHVLMMNYMKGMSQFATSLRDQAVRHEPLDVEFARAVVAELRHELDAAEKIQGPHMESMSSQMQSDMKMMMKEMGEHHSKLKDGITALEDDVKIAEPDAKQVSTHASALLEHLAMMAKAHPRMTGKSH